MDLLYIKDSVCYCVGPVGAASAGVCLGYVWYGLQSGVPVWLLLLLVESTTTSAIGVVYYLYFYHYGVCV